ncbi:MAG: PHP domain-containing protein [Chloroflexi bacterium]|nr:PHP domain-containing protein [Chloroflexota bacterium]
MKLKLDLHTHCYEASGYKAPTLDIVASIVERIKLRGLDGIAITEHYNKDYGFKVKEMVREHFDPDLIIIPGQEIDENYVQVVELYLDNNSVFRFLAHPGYPGDFVNRIRNVSGIEIENHLHNYHIEKDKVEEVARKHNLILLHNSDAHMLPNIGQCHNEIDLEELYARAVPCN